MLIDVQNINYIYSPDTPFQVHALENVSFSIYEKEFLAIIGHTGSGKSTLIQHLNGLMLPTSGKIIVDGDDLTSPDTKLPLIRQKVGLVFQYPEHQLFEETVEKDIGFAARNQGMDDDEVLKRVKKSMSMVGLDYEEYKDKSPMDLSGGQKRRVAIAGVLVMEPKVLILDEPTAGLDPAGRDEILEEIASLNKDMDLTVILVSHSMDEVARYVDRIVVMENGRIFTDGKPKEVFKNKDELKSIGLGVPQITELMSVLKSRGLEVSDEVITVDEARDVLTKLLRERSDV